MSSRFQYIKKTWQLERGMNIPSGEVYAAAKADIEYLIHLVENQNAHIENMQSLEDRYWWKKDE